MRRALSLSIALSVCMFTSSAPGFSHEKEQHAKTPDKKRTQNAVPAANISGNYKITVVEDGGFAYRHRVFAIQSQALTSEKRAELDNLLLSSGLTKAEKSQSINPAAADAISYKFEFAPDKGTVHKVEFDDTTLDKNYRKLVNFLRDNAAKNAAGKSSR